MSRVAELALSLFLVSSAFGAEVFEDRIEKVVPLAANGTFSLGAIDGSVEIYGSEDNEARIVAVRKALSLERLNQIQIRISGDGNAVTVNTTAPPQPRWSFRDHSGTVDYTITLPQHARIASLNLPNGDLVIHGMRGGDNVASVGNGRLTAHNCYCDQNLRVQRGGLDLFFDWSEPRPIAVEAVIGRGNIRAVVPSDSSFRLSATSAHGRVSSDFSEIAERKPGGVSRIEQVIGTEPLSELVLRATEGNIRISETIW